MKNNIQQFWDLSKPKMARDFLKQIRVGPPPGAKIQFLIDKDKNQIPIDQASDEQILQVAQEIAEAIEMAKRLKQ